MIEWQFTHPCLHVSHSQLNATIILTEIFFSVFFNLQVDLPLKENGNQDVASGIGQGLLKAWVALFFFSMLVFLCYVFSSIFML